MEQMEWDVFVSHAWEDTVANTVQIRSTTLMVNMAARTL